MILSQIKQHLKENSGLTIPQIQYKTGYDRAVIEQAIHTWIEKGKVTAVVQENPCAKCLVSCVSKSCAEEETLYCWIE